MQSGGNGSSRTNPFAPISYEERLSKPTPKAASAAGELPMRPGQPYIASYDKWLKKPAPLSPLRSYGNAEEEHGSHGSKHSNAYSGMDGAGYGASAILGEQSYQAEYYSRQMNDAAEAQSTLAEAETSKANAEQALSDDIKRRRRRTDRHMSENFSAREESLHSEHLSAANNTSAGFVDARQNSITAQDNEALAPKMFSYADDSSYSASSGNAASESRTVSQAGTRESSRQDGDESFASMDDGQFDFPFLSSDADTANSTTNEPFPFARHAQQEPVLWHDVSSGSGSGYQEGDSFPVPSDADTANSTTNEPFPFARHAQQEPILWHDVSADSGSDYQEGDTFPFSPDADTAGSTPSISFPFPPVSPSEPILWHDVSADSGSGYQEGDSFPFSPDTYTLRDAAGESSPQDHSSQAEPALWHDITPSAESDPTEDAAEQSAAPVSASDSPQQGSDQIAAFFAGGGISSDLPPLPSVRPDAASASEAPTPQPHKLSPEQIKQNLAQFKPPSVRRKDYEKPKKPPVRPWRVISIIAVAGMLVFVCIVGGKFLLNLSRDKQEMDNFRNEYREMYGIDPENASMLVNLPPEGSTFAPPSAGATYAPRTSEAQAALPSGEYDGGEHSSSTDSTRTRLASYPDNPLQNITDSVKAARAQNADIVGRLVIPNVLDEQIVQRNNTFYLTHSFRGSASDAGAVFADESCSFKTPPENVLLRGRDAIEGKSFAPLWQYDAGGEAFAFSAAAATLTTPYEENEFVLFAVIVTPSSGEDAFNYAGHPSFSTDTEMLEYVESARRHSLYRFNVSIDASDRLLTLATVGSGGKTMVLLFRMKRPNER